MAMTVPQDIARILKRPGREWLREEQLRVIGWLFEDHQLRHLLAFTLHYLGERATPEDAEDVFGQFCASQFQRIIELYEPNKGDFISYLLLCLKRFCWDEAQRINKRTEMEKPYPVIRTSDGEEFELEFVDDDPSLDPEKTLAREETLRIVQECLNELEPPLRVLVVMHHFEEKAVAEIAQELFPEKAHGAADSMIKVRLHRARQKLKRCLAARLGMRERETKKGPQRPKASADKPIILDVLILGGGVMGLTLLHDLSRVQCSALLLERRRLGAEQTCHSHVYIHQGYLYQNVALARALKNVNSWWRGWIGEKLPQRGYMPSLFGFLNPWDAKANTDLWDHPELQLSYDIAPVPYVLRDGAVQLVYQTPEICLDGESLVHHLARGLELHMSRVEEIAKIGVVSDAIEEVHVMMPGGKPLVFRPRALVLTAGSGNQSLLELIAGGERGLTRRIRDAQQIRKGHMLIVKGTKGELDPLTGVFPSVGYLFIVARDLGSEVVWLISDDRSPFITFVEDWIDFAPRWWLPRVIESLERLAPLYFRDSKRLKWGIYEAPKAEGRAAGGLPNQPRTEQFQIDNLWVVWPTKLTLAPDASHTIARQIQEKIGAGQAWTSAPEAWRLSRAGVAVAPERWRKTPLVPWDEFRRCYDL